VSSDCPTIADRDGVLNVFWEKLTMHRQHWQGNHESNPGFLSRRRAIHHLARTTFAATLFGRRAPLIQAEGTPEATPVRLGGSSGSEDVSFGLSGGVTTYGQFDYPADGVAPFPAVLLIQGSGPTDRHETILDPDGAVRQPFIQISNELTRRGMAVFRYDKRGVCPPSTICDAVAYAAQTKPVLIEDAALAYARMVANPRVDANRTAVLGHSEGSWLAPALPYRFPGIRALVLIGAGLGPMHVLSFSQVTLPLLGLAPSISMATARSAPARFPSLIPRLWRMSWSVSAPRDSSSCFAMRAQPRISVRLASTPGSTRMETARSTC